ncbi:MAG TPA: sensor histidine kinase [Mycobacteriales bacterium]|nr:sensor histidine kinase [Mycobacteriales bacterium]
MTEARAPLYADRWVARLDRMRRILPLPLLIVSTIGALIAPDAGREWALDPIGLPLSGAAAVLWIAVTARPPLLGPTLTMRAVFIVHCALAAVLIWVNPSYGVYAYIGFVFAYVLGRTWSKIGFAAVAVLVSASLTGGYPSAWDGQAASFAVVAVIMTALVLNTSNTTAGALEQNQERGRMIEELAETNRRLEATMAENVQLHEQLLVQAREAGIIEERQRLAGEIHDTLAQGLTGIIAQLQAAHQTRHRPEEQARHLDQAQALARSNLTEARRSVRALRPEQLERDSLPEAIAALARDWSERSGVPAELETTGTPIPAAVDIEAALFRVAQESLSNIGKHAHASRVRLTLTYLEDTVLLDVADDGTGFDPNESTAGYGLAGMRHRLGRVGGALTIESGGGYGTILNATVPLRRGEGA